MPKAFLPGDILLCSHYICRPAREKDQIFIAEYHPAWLGQERVFLTMVQCIRPTPNGNYHVMTVELGMVMIDQLQREITVINR